MFMDEDSKAPGMEETVQHAAGRSPSRNVAWLATMAKQAFEQNRTQNCLALTKAILLIDPDNAEALAMQSAIQSPIESIDEPFLQPEAVEACPDAVEACPEAAQAYPEAVQTYPEAVQAYPEAVQAYPEAVQAYPEVVQAHPEIEQPRAEPESPLLFTASPVSRAPLESLSVRDRKRQSLRRVVVTVAVGLLGLVGILWLTHPHGSQSNSAGAIAPPHEAVPARPAVPDGANEAGLTPQPPVNLTATEDTPTLAKDLIVSSQQPPEAPSEVRDPLPAPPVKAVVPVALGTLAVTSLVSTEIYEGRRRLGSTPAKLQLPTGAHEIEYRYDSMRKSASYIIRTNETSTAIVTFDVTVQINARPWAQVFLDGAPKRPLGQTPLSDVQVPVGSVLLFENPNFSGKTYRVTSKESAIQVTFP